MYIAPLKSATLPMTGQNGSEQNDMDKMVYGQNGIGQNGMDNMLRTDW